MFRQCRAVLSSLLASQLPSTSEISQRLDGGLLNWRVHQQSKIYHMISTLQGRWLVSMSGRRGYSVRDLCTLRSWCKVYFTVNE